MEESTIAASRVHDVRPEYWALLTDSPYPDGGNPFWRIVWFMRAQALWLAHRQEVLAHWIPLRPGTRPSSWWRFEMPLMREQLGGKGKEGSGGSWCGLPRSWWLGGFSYVDPPIFESQAAFLLRNNLLPAAERGRLDNIDFMPTPIPENWWPQPDV